MTEEKQFRIICEALGESSVLFMSQKCSKGMEIIMPTEKLEKIAYKAVIKLNS